MGTAFPVVFGFWFAAGGLFYYSPLCIALVGTAFFQNSGHSPEKILQVNDRYYHHLAVYLCHVF